MSIRDLQAPGRAASVATSEQSSVGGIGGGGSGAFDQTRLELIGSNFVYGGATATFLADGRATAAPGYCVSTSPRGCALTTGKHYFELTVWRRGCVRVGFGGQQFGADSGFRTIKAGDDSNSVGFDVESGAVIHRGAQIDTRIRTPCVAGDTIGVYLDCESGTAAFSINTSYEKGLCVEIAITIALPIIPLITFDSSSLVVLNFGERPFRNSPTVDGVVDGYRSVKFMQRELVEAHHVLQEKYRFGNVEGSSGQTDMTITHNDDGTVTLEAGDGFPSAVMGGVCLSQGVWYWEFVVTEWPGKHGHRLFQIGWGDMQFSGNAKRPGSSHGCGDDKHSWGYDSGRAPAAGLWHGDGYHVFGRAALTAIHPVVPAEPGSAMLSGGDGAHGGSNGSGGSGHGDAHALV